MFFCKCKQGNRIDSLEKREIETTKDIETLLGRLGNMIWWTRALVITLLPLVLTAFAFLVLEVFGKKV